MSEKRTVLDTAARGGPWDETEWQVEGSHQLTVGGRTQQSAGGGENPLILPGGAQCVEGTKRKRVWQAQHE